MCIIFYSNPEKRLSELVGSSDISRNWKNPSDFGSHEDLENEIPAPHQKCTAGIEVLPKILEENEEEPAEDPNKHIVNKDIKRLSVISSKLEELIEVDITKIDGSTSPVKGIQENAIKFQDRTAKSDKSNIICSCCCSSYQKFRYRRRIKSLCDCLMGTALKPLIGCCKILAFYPCLLSVVHSMFSPLVFLNFMPVMAKEDSRFGNMTEVSFMLSITAFAYICFLITVPWVADISNRKLRYLYLFGLGMSAIALYRK